MKKYIFAIAISFIAAAAFAGELKSPPLPMDMSNFEGKFECIISNFADLEEPLKGYLHFEIDNYKCKELDFIAKTELGMLEISSDMRQTIINCINNQVLPPEDLPQCFTPSQKHLPETFISIENVEEELWHTFNEKKESMQHVSTISPPELGGITLTVFQNNEETSAFNETILFAFYVVTEEEMMPDQPQFLIRFVNGEETSQMIATADLRAISTKTWEKIALPFLEETETGNILSPNYFQGKVAFKSEINRKH